METGRFDQYKRLSLMVFLSFVAMYILMFAMVDSPANIFFSINQFYMTALMTSPMIILELLLMSEMYGNKKMNTLLMVGSAILLVTSFVFIQNQTFISDKQFLRSMIPHHAGAMLMCKNATLQDPEIKQLCLNILSGQKQEIDQMKAQLDQIK